MAWEEPPPYRDTFGERGNPLLWLLNGSVPLFTAFRVPVRLHATFILFILLELVLGAFNPGYYLQYRIVGMGMLFGLILMHEFGHCFAARSVGGDADQILLTPLGGLAFVDSPKHPWPRFVTAAGGPAVNVAVCLFMAIGIVVFSGTHDAPPVNPFNPWPRYRLGWSNPELYCWWMFVVSYYNLLFNILPLYPLDGGRILQTALWPKMGYYRSMMAATRVGLIAAGVLGIYGVYRFNLLIILIALWCFLACRQERTMLKAEGHEPWEVELPDFSASLYDAPGFGTRKPKKVKVNRRAIEKARRQARLLAEEGKAVDRILAKVSASGMASLTMLERRILRKATKHRRG